MLSGKTILVGITGGIAAYKICELIRMYKRANANVLVVCTQNALNFVTKLTLQNLSQNEVAVEEFEVNDFKPEHISYADCADIMVIAPATANTISKIASGVCDNLLTSIACAFTKPVIIAPAMNCNMWENPVVQDNLHKLHYEILEPESGYLACGYEGKGRLCSLEKIFDKTVELLNHKPLNNKKIVITSGGTIEDIDPVRYISNYSSGKMGLALADTAKNLGAEVTLITTKDVSRKYSVIKVKSALDMKSAVEKEFENADCVIMAAAVADYRVKEIASQKIKKTCDDEISLTLVKNPDILKEISLRKTRQIVVGFCAESENLIENAKEKIHKKGCDYLIANDISRKDIGFSSDYNEVTILDKNGNMKKLEKADKLTIARKIFEEIYG
ncbi:MAG TPA: bifunctional phosphopantothenoylcysteine decarboxylase/phosphopantothenate--cysteine ligase CoaBC [Candidatus Stercorousia faecigallinarum]|nr:bifunctional phosphopantothenoylcysteine decarboxylase/phosphopantothenate--cysteine ligase CoaBC [Candidatus Stercorousia faecigallinarum]